MHILEIFTFPTFVKQSQNMFSWPIRIIRMMSYDNFVHNESIDSQKKKTGKPEEQKGVLSLKL